ncbi:MAG: TVP38/TMEM64 family protein, partial [Planctomycetota bacterium]
MIPGSAATLAIGAIYGPWIGLLIVSPASVLGATMAFVLGRGVFRPTIEKRMQGSNKFKALQAAISDNGLKILTLVRLSPIFPFTVINYAFGLTRISLRKYVVGSFVGMLPGTLLYVYLGSAVGDVGQLMSDGVQDSGRAGSLMFYGGLIATAVVTIIITKAAKQALAAATTSTANNNDTITK